MHFRLYDSKGEELVHKINIGNVIRWLLDNKYFENHPDEVLRLEYRDLIFSHEITKDTTIEEIKELAEGMEKFY